jgi:hypothetical protein
VPYRCSIGRIGALSRLVVRKFHLILGSAGSDSKSINSLRPRQTPAACSLLPNKKRLAQTTHRPCASCARRLQLLANGRPTRSGRSRNTVGRPTKEYRSIDFFPRLGVWQRQTERRMDPTARIAELSTTSMPPVLNLVFTRGLNHRLNGRDDYLRIVDGNHMRAIPSDHLATQARKAEQARLHLCVIG